MKKLYKCLPAVVFVGFIFTMLILFIVLPKRGYSPSEKRILEQAPQLTDESLMSGDFGEHFEKFLSDQTAGRNMWVGLAAYYNYAVGNNGSSGVYKCSDGYLINDPEDMSGLMRNIGFIEEFSEHIDVPVTALIAPSTGYICSDKLPLIHKPYHDDEYFSKISDTLDTASFVDIREAFKSAYADGDQMYYRTDHHWTAYGAYTAYTALAAELGYTANDMSAYDIASYPGFYGTTYSSSGFWDTAPDDIEVWDNKANDGALSVAVTDNGETCEQDEMFYYSHLDEDDKYPVYLDGNHPYTVIKNSGASSDEKLLVVKDSFAHSLVPFLADHYSEIIMVDMRYYSLPLPALIESEGVDRVLFIYSIDNLATDTKIALIE